MMRQMRKGSRRKIDSDGDGGHALRPNDARRSSDTSSLANSDTTSSHYSRTLKNRGRLRDAVAQGRKKKQELRKKISGGKKEDQKSSSILPISGGFKGREGRRMSSVSGAHDSIGAGIESAFHSIDNIDQQHVFQLVRDRRPETCASERVRGGPLCADPYS